jgi:hypothetical protein
MGRSGRPEVGPSRLPGPGPGHRPGHPWTGFAHRPSRVRRWKLERDRPQSSRLAAGTTGPLTFGHRTQGPNTGAAAEPQQLREGGGRRARTATGGCSGLRKAGQQLDWQLGTCRVGVARDITAARGEHQERAAPRWHGKAAQDHGGPDNKERASCYGRRYGGQTLHPGSGGQE